MSERTKVVDGVALPLDEDGFLQAPQLWSEKVAEAFARDEGITAMTPEHWKIVNYLRDYFQKFGIAPMIRKVCKENDMKLAEIYDLFPTGPAKGACKAAGLPKPTGCV